MLLDMRTTQSLKVPVATLLANAEAARKKVIDEHAAALAASKYDVDAVRREIADKLADASWAYDCDNPKPRRLPEASNKYVSGKGYTPHVTVVVSIPIPPKVEKKADTRQIDRDIALLKATSQSDISVRVDGNFSQYL